MLYSEGVSADFPKIEGSVMTHAVPLLAHRLAICCLGVCRESLEEVCSWRRLPSNPR
jgi:hypothetical protein